MRKSFEDPCSDRNAFVGKQSAGFGDGGYTERVHRICERRIFRMPAVHRNGIRTVLRNFSRFISGNFPRFIFRFLSGFISGIFSEKIPGIFRENFPEKARKIPPGLFHGKPYPKIPKSMTESIGIGTDRYVRHRHDGKSRRDFSARSCTHMSASPAHHIEKENPGGLPKFSGNYCYENYGKNPWIIFSFYFSDSISFSNSFFNGHLSQIISFFLL